MADVEDYSTTAASNTDDFPENQAPSTVNNGGREAQADIAAWHQRLSANNVVGGTADALTFASTPAHTSLVNGRTIIVRATSDNATTTPTFNLDSLGAKTIVKFGNEVLSAGDIQAGGYIILKYRSTSAIWELLNPATPAAGSIDASHLAANSVDTSEIATDAVTANEIDFTSSGTNNISLAATTGVGLNNIAWVTGHSSIEIQVNMNTSGTGAGSSSWQTVAALSATPQLVYLDDATNARLYNTDIVTRYYNKVEIA